jgi:hypothetical protein
MIKKLKVLLKKSRLIRAIVRRLRKCCRKLKNTYIPFIEVKKYNRLKNILKDPNYKIGLISINTHTKVLNFASPIHTYAFQQFLNECGIENEVINYKPCYYGTFDPRHPYDFYKKKKDSGAKVNETEMSRWLELYDEREVRFDRFEDFINDNYKITKECYNQDTLDQVDLGYDAYMCVTDVIWKYNPVNGFDRGFFLACETMKNKPKIAYSASIGASKSGYKKEQGEKFYDLIQPFDYISVREKSFYKYVNSKTNKKASLVLDPVFFHNDEFYKKHMILPKRKGYVLIYIVMGQNEQLVQTAIDFAKEHNLDVIELSEFLEHKNVGGQEHEMIYGIGIEDWLGYMYNADYIFTNSFHCCVFSIIFNKQFFAGKRAGDKIPWLLEIFGLSNRRVMSAEQCHIDDIDYTNINKLKDKYVLKSKRYVLQAINEVKNHTHKNLSGIEKDFI